MIEKNEIIKELNEVFGEKGYIWEEDNAPPHSPSKREFASKMKMLDWPAKSPDLSPIEQIWHYLKTKIRGRNFSNADELFTALSDEWDKIPDQLIRSLCDRFPARLRVCMDFHGDSLNGHWSLVHDAHHTH